MATDTAARRLTKELAELQKGPNLSLAVSFSEQDILRDVHAVIVGPPDTPYAFGFFEFLCRFPKTYPNHPPIIRAITTNGGQTRFNPNIYANGKVCLSILGTWPGEASEGWSTAQGLESTLLSIQSLMSGNPYENEPGFEGVKIDNKDAAAYAAKIRHETIRVSVVQRLESLLNIQPPPKVEERPVKRLRTHHGSSTAVLTPSHAAAGAPTNQALDNAAAAIAQATAALTQAAALLPVPSILPVAANSPTPQSSQASGPDADDDEEDDEDDEDGYNVETSYLDGIAGPSSHAFAELDRPRRDEDVSAESFTDVYKRRFLLYYDTYIKTIEGASKGIKEGEQFRTADFEYPSNGMPGSYRFNQLKDRLLVIRKALDKETQDWVQMGAEAFKKQRMIARNMQSEFEQVKQYYDKSDNTTSSFEISLIDNNPFVWNITLYGRYSTDLDGGSFNIRIHFSCNFPEEQPRVYVVTPLFHHRVSATGGVLCYFPAKEEVVKSHIEAILSAIEDDEPAYDPRTVVNPEAAALLWGTADQKKVYRRRLRQTVAASASEA